MQGLLERLAVDTAGANWLLTGSSRGHLTLWDMRFHLAVNSIQQPQVCAPPPSHPPSLVCQRSAHASSSILAE